MKVEVIVELCCEAFWGVQVTDDILLRKRRQSTEKKERIPTATVFLSSELFDSFPVLAVK